jgi:hypothetical protein
MPFASSSQRKYLYAKKPDVARKFAEHSDRKGQAIPSKVAMPIVGRARNNG